MPTAAATPRLSFAMFLVTASHLLCQRGALAFRPSVLLSHCSYRVLPRQFPLSTTKLKRQEETRNDSSSDKVEPTWVFTPYQPSPQPKPRSKTTITRQFSSSPEWTIPDIIPIPEESLQITFARSSGAGGQNVNKVNTKVELRFHVDTASWIPAEVRERLKINEANRINNEGYFSLTCQENRTQVQNRKEALRKLQDILRESWKRPKVRKMRKGLSQKTKENRREMKRRVSEKKANRKSVDF